MIFVVAADSRHGTPARAAAAFLRRGNIPTYATSDIYDPAAPARDNDLNGFIFADTPAVLSPDADASAVRAELQAYWPQRSDLLRFYAMGFDAYGLIAPLYANDGAAWPMRGLSGDLSLDAQGRVRRVLPLAQFRNGRPVALERGAATDRRRRPHRRCAECGSRAADSGSRAPPRYLERHGLAILARGYRCRLGELDLVCREDRDARHRRSARPQPAAHCAPRSKASTRTSAARIVQATRHLLMRHAEWQAATIRFDVVAFDAHRHAGAADPLDQERLRRQLNALLEVPFEAE